MTSLRSSLGRGRARPVRRVESLAGRTLLAAARQRKDLDPARCRLVFEHLDAAASVRCALQRALAAHRLGDLQFGVLVALLALDPEPVTPADLAGYTAVARAAVSDALGRLAELKLVTRARDPEDGRVYHLQLTAKGRSTVDAALETYLGAMGRVARYLRPEAQPDLLTAYERLQRGAAEFDS